MKCPHCNRPGNKRYRGYCSKVHYKLHKRRPQKINIPCTGCGKVQRRNPSQILPSGNVYCSECKRNRGETHPKWKEGQYINKDGYRMILNNGSYQREHRVVWEGVNKACLLPGGTIHHIDYDKLNNSRDNLLLFSNEEHGRFHRLIELNRFPEAATLLKVAADRQYYYPIGVDAFILRALSNS